MFYTPQINYAGSSPRVWGQVKATNIDGQTIRIIPTRVGTSPVKTLPSRRLWDHPHACGDKCGGGKWYTRHVGSSPRVWGQVDGSIYRVALSGIIPTRVGTSDKLVRGYLEEQDHPHACGDKATVLMTKQSPLGSSPRVWGQAVTVGAVAIPSGIIPTRVGTSDTYSSDTPQGRDHPHACGDKLVMFAPAVLQ